MSPSDFMIQDTLPRTTASPLSAGDLLITKH